jgi:hypothetical protein
LPNGRSLNWYDVKMAPTNEVGPESTTLTFCQHTASAAACETENKALQRGRAGRPHRAHDAADAHLRPGRAHLAIHRESVASGSAGTDARPRGRDVLAPAVHIHPVHHRLHVRRGPGASRRAGRGHAHACGTMHAAPTAIARWDGRGAHVLRSPGGPAALARRWRRRAAHPLHVNCACTASGTPSTVVAVRTSSASRPHTAARVMAVLRFGRAPRLGRLR